MCLLEAGGEEEDEEEDDEEEEEEEEDEEEEEEMDEDETEEENNLKKKEEQRGQGKVRDCFLYGSGHLSNQSLWQCLSVWHLPLCEVSCFLSWTPPHC